MECNVCREALSARIDGERELVASEQVDNHRADCAECSSWYETALDLSRRLRVRTVQVGPDFSAAILDRVDSAQPVSRRPHAAVTRALLALTGLAQCGIGVAQLAGFDLGMPGSRADHMSGHLFNESTAWDLAIGIGMIYCALRTRAIGGLIPVLAGFAAVLSLFVAHDLAEGAMTIGRAASHLVVVAGLVLAVLVRIGEGRRRPPPDERRQADELGLPPGARYGRRNSHLRSSHDPAA